jgi:hypothetical protein
MMQKYVGMPRATIGHGAQKRTSVQAKLISVRGYMLKNIVPAPEARNFQGGKSGYPFRRTVPECNAPVRIDEIGSVIENLQDLDKIVTVHFLPVTLITW